MELFYRTYGSGFPLTILHGFLGAGGNWHTLSRNVFGERHRVLVPDLRNHGESPHDARMDYEAMAQDILDLWDAEGIERGHLMGHSMGGKVAMQVALTAPERIERLVVVDIAPRAYPPGHLEILAALEEAEAVLGEGRDAVDAVLARTVQSAPVRQFLMKNLRREGDGYVWQPNLTVLNASYDRLINGLDVMATFDGPALFVRGNRSDYVQDDDLGVIQAYFPEAEVATVEGAGHWVHAERPREFADAVMAFLHPEG